MGLQADSSWVIALIDSGDHHHSEAVAQFQSIMVSPALSAFALGEILSGIHSRRREKLKQITAAFESIVPVDSQIAAKGAEIRVEHGLSLGDAIIVASAFVHDTELLTFDKKMKAVFERLK